ncbi:UNVERIFIED_CONTAM: hypothetical protein Sradi_3814400 [Sesamum radiatum]|uniref:Uncharacterized protein n=1 Tax=Sesamum radiatum TaxID=300843 RepID=A0AAW2Q096_SESRA
MGPAMIILITPFLGGSLTSAFPAIEDLGMSLTGDSGLEFLIFLSLSALYFWHSPVYRCSMPAFSNRDRCFYGSVVSSYSAMVGVQ